MIFLGAIGGFVAMGIIGLFVGAIVPVGGLQTVSSVRSAQQRTPINPRRDVCICFLSPRNEKQTDLQSASTNVISIWRNDLKRNCTDSLRACRRRLQRCAVHPRFHGDNELRMDALFSYAITLPSEVPPARMKAMYHELKRTPKAEEGEKILVMAALDEGLVLAGKKATLTGNY